MKYLDKVDENDLLKRLTEKIWKNYKDELNNKKLKAVLKDILNKERIGFTHTWRINDSREYGTMFGTTFENYERIMREVNYRRTKEYFDAKFTKEVDTTFEYDREYLRGNIVLIENLFNTEIKTDYSGNPYIVGTVKEDLKKFLQKNGYTLYKKYINYGKYNGKTNKEKRFYLVA